VHRFALSTVAAGVVFAASGLLVAAHAGTPAYSSPCGHSAESTAPASPTLVGIPPSGLGNGDIGIIGPDGYLEANGSAAGPSGDISGATAPKDPSVYGSVGNDGADGKTGPQICIGSGSTTVSAP
jgi:hypothetical protein